MSENLSTAELHARAATIASLMRGWSYPVPLNKDADGNQAYYAIIEGTGRAQIALSAQYVSGKYRLVARSHARWSLPDNTRFETPYGFETEKATFALDRPASAVATEILRKVAPNAGELAAHYLAACNARTQLVSNHAQAIADLRAVGFDVRESNNNAEPTAYIYGTEGDAKIVNGQVRIDRVYLSAEKAIDVLRLLKKEEA